MMNKDNNKDNKDNNNNNNQNNTMSNSNNTTTTVSAQYKGFTLMLARGTRGPVILVINQALTSRRDGVVEVRANVATARHAVDRLSKQVAHRRSMEESDQLLSTGRGSDLAAAMMNLNLG